MRGDAWAAMSAADKLATRFGSLEAAERAWRAHRPMLAAVDRDVLATAARAGRREQAAPPFAHRVFQPDTPWPPPEPGP
jgi:hypothetical protein